MSRVTLLGVVVLGAFAASTTINFLLALMGNIADFLFLAAVVGVAAGIVWMKDRKIAALDRKIEAQESVIVELRRDLKGTLSSGERAASMFRLRG